jgi:hypothetical protein
MDLTGWLDFFVGGLATQLGEVVASGKRVMFSDVVAREYGLNARQASIVELLLERQDLRREDVDRRFPRVNRRTLPRDLEGLIERRIVKSSGAARGRPLSTSDHGLMKNRDRIATRIATSRYGSRPAVNTR